MNSTSSIYFIARKPIRVMEENPELRRRSCHCGDSKKLRKLVDNFASTTSLHGAVYLTNKPSRKCGCLWKIMVVLCFIIVINSTYNLFYEAITKQSHYISTLNKDAKDGKEEDENFPVYPGITICRMPPWLTDLNNTMLEWVQYAYLAFGPPYISLTAEQQSQLLRNPNKGNVGLSVYKEKYDEMKKQIPDFSIKRFLLDQSVKCEGMFRSCILSVLKMNCCEIFKPIMTTLGVCFALSPTERFKNFVSSAHDFTYPFIIDMHSPPHGVELMEVGFLVAIYDPVQTQTTIEPRMGTFIYPNSASHVTVKLKMVRREAVYTTWADIGANCPSLPVELESMELLRKRYNVMLCGVKELEAVLRRMCNCSWLIHSNDVEDESIELCEPEQMYTCFFKIFTSDGAQKDNCRHPCIEYNYETVLSYAGLGGINVTRVNIRYDNIEYLFSQYHRHTISTFFSQLGGTLGLMLGASIITVVELILFIIQWIWYQFIPVKERVFGRNRVRTNEPSAVEIDDYAY